MLNEAQCSKLLASLDEVLSLFKKYHFADPRITPYLYATDKDKIHFVVKDNSNDGLFSRGRLKRELQEKLGCKIVLFVEGEIEKEDNDALEKSIPLTKKALETELQKFKVEDQVPPKKKQKSIRKNGYEIQASGNNGTYVFSLKLIHTNINLTDKDIDDLLDGFNSTVETKLSKPELKHDKKRTVKT